MAEQCVNCGQKITDGGLISDPNQYLSDRWLRILNFVNATAHEAMCNKCGGEIHASAELALQREQAKLKEDLEKASADFPMMTIGVLPGRNEFRVLGMVTANVAVGTGLFNEFSQGVSDFFGTVNVQSGMASKVNKGEAATRGILVQRAIQMGANCIIGVDVDYGVTNNNAATVNMQGTAVRIPDLRAILGDEACEAAEWIEWAWKRLKDLHRWSRGDIREGEVYSA